MLMSGLTMVLLAAQAAPSPALPAPPDTVAEFLRQVDDLVAIGGDAAVSSPQADVIRAALQASALAYRASLAEAAARGEAPPSCPPPPGQAQLSLGDITGYLRAFPEVNRAMPLETAFALVMTLRYPCAAPSQ